MRYDEVCQMDVGNSDTAVLALRAARSAIAQFTEKKVLTLAAAQKIVAAAQAEAERNKLAGVIAVVDGGWPILLVRMDNAAYVASVELAPGKARTGGAFQETDRMTTRTRINRAVGFAAVTARDFTEMKGGLPIIVSMGTGRWWYWRKFRHPRS